MPDTPTPEVRVAVHQTEMKATLGTGATIAIGVCALLTLVGFGIGGAGVVIALVIGLALVPLPFLIALALWVDRFEPEPRRLLIEMFLWGAFVATFFAGIANEVGQSVVSGSLGKGAGEIYGGSISAPVVEESLKAMAIWLIWRRARDEIDGIVDGVVYALVVAIGFATVENVYYYAEGAYDDGVVGALGVFVARALFSPLAHPLFTAMTGIGFGLAATTGRRWLRASAPFGGLVLAILLHSAWNTSTLSEETAFAVYLLFFVPLLISLAIFVGAVRARETRVVSVELEPEVAAGLMTPAEIDELASIKRRKAALKRAKFLGGKPARSAALAYQRAATDLAFLRKRIGRADGDRAAALKEREPAAATEFLRAREALTGAS